MLASETSLADQILPSGTPLADPILASETHLEDQSLPSAAEPPSIHNMIVSCLPSPTKSLISAASSPLILPPPEAHTSDNSQTTSVGTTSPLRMIATDPSSLFHILVSPVQMLPFETSMLSHHNHHHQLPSSEIRLLSAQSLTSGSITSAHRELASDTGPSITNMFNSPVVPVTPEIKSPIQQQQQQQELLDQLCSLSSKDITQ